MERSKDGCGSCGACGGRRGELVLTEGELEVLDKLAQIPFLPVSRRADSMEPVCPGEPDPAYGQLLLCLEKKGLISLDYDMPLVNFRAEDGLPIHGSMALTARGQAVVELMERQGVAREG